MDRQKDGVNATMERYLQVFLNHQQHDWVQWLPLVEFAAKNEILETTRCPPFYAVQGTDPQLSFPREPMEEHGHRRLNADLVQATMQRIYEHIRVEMR
jgi:hypothetical protein